ncbi:MAG: sugar transferase [Bacteroidales bacterium]|nr:sugar transferase [Bacteroidales bacterium]MCF8343865.1 sugar transferase [Bacteroidales bacterium]MCF8375262.1 sugar transferase [Bacteroidales bacterium]MCF8400286.1 sugar transferase [Bacteroidales bacterium]
MENKGQEKYKILYIGGDTNIINQLKEADTLFNLKIVEHGLAAVGYLKDQQEISAIICEDNLPGMNGIGLHKMITSRLKLTETPFIIISHEKKPELKQEAIKAGIDDLYFLPIRTEHLHTRIAFLSRFKKEYQSQSENSAAAPEYKIPLIKRLFDVFVSGIALILLSPLFLLVAIAIKIESKGPLFYTSKRVGTGYKIFDFYKFRSMFTGADARLKELEHLNKYAGEKEEKGKPEMEIISACPRCAKLPEGEYCSPTLYAAGEKICEYWYGIQKKEKGHSTFKKIKDDPRVTKVGKFIRNTSIDELPQLINVLKGDMSIVGNRPLPLYEAELLTSDDWSARFMGPAGITGLWQVELRGKKGEMSEEERKALDNQYARTYSFWGDIRLIMRTIPALLQRDSV